MKRIGILGCGGIAGQHIDALLALPDAWQIVAVADLNNDLAQAAAARCGARVASPGEIVTAPDIDVVDICLPPALHTKMTLMSLQHRKHVVCEKPIAGSMADVARIAGAAGRLGRQVFPVFQYRYGPAFRRLKALSEAGLLGPPRVATLETHWSRDAVYYATPWRGTWAHEMGGACLSHAIHIHDLASVLCGPIRTVSAMVDTLINPIETEDCAAIVMSTETGCLMTSSITLGAAGDESRLRIVFEKATVESARNPYAPGDAAWRISARDPALQADLEAVVGDVGGDGFVGYFADVEAALAGRENRAVTLDDGAKSIELVTAIYQSARDGSAVSLPLTPDAPLFHGWGPA